MQVILNCSWGLLDFSDKIRLDISLSTLYMIHMICQISFTLKLKLECFVIHFFLSALRDKNLCMMSMCGGCVLPGTHLSDMLLPFHHKVTGGT